MTPGTFIKLTTVARPASAFSGLFIKASNDSSTRNTTSASDKARDCDGFKVYRCGDSDPVSSTLGVATPSITNDAKEWIGGMVATTRGCAAADEIPDKVMVRAVRTETERIVILYLYVML